MAGLVEQAQVAEAPSRCRWPVAILDPRARTGSWRRTGRQAHRRRCTAYIDQAADPLSIALPPARGLRTCAMTLAAIQAGGRSRAHRRPGQAASPSAPSPWPKTEPLRPLHPNSIPACAAWPTWSPMRLQAPCIDAYLALPTIGRALAVVGSRDDERRRAPQRSLFRQLLTYMMGDPRNDQRRAPTVACSCARRAMSAIGDHATNIARGRPLRDHGRRDDRRPRWTLAGKLELRTWAICPPRRRTDGALTATTETETCSLVSWSMEDEDALATAACSYNLEAEGLRRPRRHADGDEAHRPDRRADRARSGPAGLDAARPLRHRAVPPLALARGNRPRADHHDHRPRRGSRARARPCDRRG